MQGALKSLAVVEDQIAVTNLHAARWMAYTFIEADRASRSRFRKVALYQLTAEAVKTTRRCGLALTYCPSFSLR